MSECEKCKSCNRCKKLENFIRQLHWMARRYCDNRRSYVTSLFNNIVCDLLLMQVFLTKDDGSFFAKDAGGSEYDGLSVRNCGDDDL